MLVAKSVFSLLPSFPRLLRIRGYEATGPLSQTKFQLSTHRQTREFEKILKAEEHTAFMNPFNMMNLFNLSEKNKQNRKMRMVQPEGDLSVDTTLSSNHDHQIDSNDVLFVPSNSMRPEDFDVVTNIEDGDFVSIGAKLGVVRLSKAVTDASFDSPVRGIMFGRCLRWFVPLTVRNRNRDIVVNVLFTFDTGSPHTYLCRETFLALGFTEPVPGSAIVSIQGRSITAYLSTKHFENVDLLGQELLMFLGVTATIDYSDSSLKLEAHKK